MISFVLYILAISITIQYTLANNPVCDGSQIVYATPPSIDPLTGEIIGAGLDAITLSVDEANTLISNIIGIASDMHELAPDQQPEMEIIRSASINPLTTDLLLLYQEINYADPLMNEPRQRLVIIPGFKLNSLLVPSPGILGYEINDNIDLSETELDEEYPLTEIAFDCAGNLLGVTAEGELVQMIIEAGSSDLETKYIGPVQFQGGIVGLAQGFVGLTYDFQTNVFVAVGGIPIANTLVQFAVADCVVIQFGNPIIITDQYGLCPLGIVDIESRGNNQFYISCAIDANTFGLAILELVEGIAEILPINAADGQSLVVLPNSSGGALIPSIPSTSSAANTNANAVCFPRNIGAPMCNVVPTESDCEGDITIELVMAPPTAAFVPPGLGGVPPGFGGNIVPPADAVPQTGISVNAVSGTYGYGLEAGAGSVGATATGLGTSFNGEVIPGTEGTAFGPAVGGLGLGLGLGFDGDDFGEGLGSAAQGSSVDGGDDTDNQSVEEEEAADAETDLESEEEEEDVATADDDTSADDEPEDDDDIEGDDDTSADDESEDDDDAELDDDDDEESASDDDNETDLDDDVDDEEDTLDGDGDSSFDDDDETDRDSVDPFSFDFERGSAEDAQLNGNNFNRNGFLNAEDGYNNGQGTMISLSPSTLANLWGLAMIFLGINLTFLCICYYRNGQCQKKQVTVDDNDGDIESL